MKRLLCSLLALCAVLSLLPATCFAAGERWYLEELGLSLEIPGGLDVFTRDVPADDPNLLAYGITRDELIDALTAQNAYLDAWNEDVSLELIVRKLDLPVEDFNTFGDAALRVLAESMRQSLGSFNASGGEWEVYRHSQTKFLKISAVQQPEGSGPMYNLMYLTVLNGITVGVTLVSVEPFTAEGHALADGVVDSIRFDAAAPEEPFAAQTEAFSYTDERTGLTFTVPANWREPSLPDEAEVPPVFCPNGVSDPFIAVLTRPIEEILDESPDGELSNMGLNARQYGFLLEFFEDDPMFMEGLAEGLGVEEEDVTRVELGGKDYFSLRLEYSFSPFGASVSLPFEALIRWENSTLYMFMFSGERDDPLYADFESLAASAVYPEAGSGDNPIYVVILSLLFLGWFLLTALYLLPILLCRFAVKKAPVGKKTARTAAVLWGLFAAAAGLLLWFFAGLGLAFAVTALLLIWVNYRILTAGGGSVRSAGFPAGGCIVPPERVPEPLPGVGIPGAVPPAFCRRCGAPVSDRASFCTSCGARLPDGIGSR